MLVCNGELSCLAGLAMSLCVCMSRGVALAYCRGDFLQDIAVKADCYVMKSVLHDCNDSSCLTILRNLRAVMPDGSTLVNFDRLMPPFGDQDFHPAKAMDINMMVRPRIHPRIHVPAMLPKQPHMYSTIQ